MLCCESVVQVTVASFHGGSGPGSVRSNTNQDTEPRPGHVGMKAHVKKIQRLIDPGIDLRSALAVTPDGTVGTGAVPGAERHS